jgi:hypothetical protein
VWSSEILPPNVSTAAELRSFAGLAVSTFSSSRRLAQTHGEGSVGLRGKIDLIVRQVNQVLRVKCAEGCCHGCPDSHDSFFHTWSKQCDPQLAPKQQLRATHRGWALRMGRAINVHLLARRCCIIPDAVPMGVLAISVHLRLQRVSGAHRM